MSKAKVFTDTLRDYYNQDLNIGDLVLGAKEGGRYRNVSYVHSIVIGRTERMIQVHQVIGTDTPAKMLNTLNRRGYLGGRVRPSEVIRVEEGLFTEAQIKQAQAPMGTVVTPGSDLKLPKRPHVSSGLRRRRTQTVSSMPTFNP